VDGAIVEGKYNLVNRTPIYVGMRENYKSIFQVRFGVKMEKHQTHQLQTIQITITPNPIIYIII
jgi:hypothetical protein